MVSNFHPCNLCGEIRYLHLLFERFGHPILKCGNCSLVFVAEIPSGIALEGLYSDSFFISSKFTDGENSSSFLNALERVALALNLPLIQTNAWLDIGCATGDFLLAADRVAHEVHGSDISTHAIQVARERGIKHTQVGDFLSLSYPKGHFDVVTMWDLIEHVSNPMATLRKANQLLLPGGVLLISTGDVDSLLSRIMGRFWHLMIPPLHLYFFSTKTIRRYLEVCGFEDIHITYRGKLVPLDFLVEKFFRLIHAGLGEWLTSVISRTNLGRVKFRLNFFDIMTISARKPSS